MVQLCDSLEPGQAVERSGAPVEVLCEQGGSRDAPPAGSAVAVVGLLIVSGRSLKYSGDVVEGAGGPFRIPFALTECAREVAERRNVVRSPGHMSPGR